MIAQNPAASIKLPKVKKYRSEVYNEREIRTLLEKIHGTDMELPKLSMWFSAYEEANY